MTLPSILTPSFQHPADHWYMIEPKGEHPNRRAGVTLVIDDPAIQQIVTRFNEDAAASRLRHGHELLVDHEHFKDESDKESRAYGWLTNLIARADGIFGQIRWTATGKAAVDGGDYRFFSTEYDPRDCESLINTGLQPGAPGPVEKETASAVSQRLRPLRLDGLTLTNMPNNRGQKPITNRNSEPSNLEPRTLNLESGSEFRAGQAGTQNREQMRRSYEAPLQPKGKMNSIACKLGLAAEASEEAVLDALTKIINRADEATQRLTTAQGRIALLETENATLLNDQIEADFAAAGIKDEKIINRHKPLLSDPKHFKNRQDRVAFIQDLTARSAGPLPSTLDTRPSQRTLHNRDTRPPALDLDKGLEAQHRAEATKIQNRAFELLKQMPNLSTATAYTMAQSELRN